MTDAVLHTYSTRGRVTPLAAGPSQIGRCASGRFDGRGGGPDCALDITLQPEKRVVAAAAAGGDEAGQPTAHSDT